MNIVHKLTWRHLMKNKRRTLVTIIGVIISVAMISGVATLATSFISFAKKEHIANEGEWHVLYKNVTDEQLKAIEADKNTEKIILSRDLGYSYLKESENPSKPYLFFKQYNLDGFKQFPIEVIEGKVPANDDELLISEHIMTNGQVTLEIGDQITANIGERMTEEEVFADYPLGQTLGLQIKEEQTVEIINQQQQKTYTVVGVMKRPTWEPYNAPGFTVLSLLSEDNITKEERFNVSVVWNDVNRNILEHAEKLGETLRIEDVSINNSLLRYDGLIEQDFVRSSVYSVSLIVMLIIIIGSVSLIYNAFAISVSERARHLGMLSSVGATKKQKRNSVFFEGLIIGMISIPFGIISGIGGIAITFYFINPLFQSVGQFNEKLTVAVTPLSIVAAIVIAILTILISTYMPARRASRISAIDAIRQTEDIKLSRKQVKTSRLVRKIFGIEAEFGLKNLKRNKRRYHTTVFSLVISIILFLTVSFFGKQMIISSNVATSGLNYDIKIINETMNKEKMNDNLIDSIVSIEEVTNFSEVSYAYVNTKLSKEQVPEIAEEFVGHDDSIHLTLELNIPDEKSLQAYAEEVGVSYERLIDKDNLSAIIINTAKNPSKRMGEITPLNMKPGEFLHVSYYDEDTDKDIETDEIEVIELTDKRPIGVDQSSVYSINVIISEEVFNELNRGGNIGSIPQLILTTTDPLGIHEKLEHIVSQQMYIFNPHQQQQEEKRVVLLMSVFTYGFIGLITLISIANIFNTISTSISLRKREFGMLKSVGMTPKGFNRMIHYESLFYGIKSILYGLPISIGIMYLIYISLSDAFDYPFQLPWDSIIGTIIAVFLIVGTAMLYSSSKVKKENIIDALKQENI